MATASSERPSALERFRKWMAQSWMFVVFFIGFFLVWEGSIRLFKVPLCILAPPSLIVNLQRDGGIASPGNAAYTYNVSSAASFTGRIEQLLENLSASQNFDPSAGIGASGSLTTYANASVSWIQAQNQQASNQADYQNSLATQAASALSNATGVNLDSQMNEMLNLENTYTTSAKLLTTLNNMFSSLLTAVVPLAA